MWSEWMAERTGARLLCQWGNMSKNGGGRKLTTNWHERWWQISIGLASSTYCTKLHRVTSQQAAVCVFMPVRVSNLMYSSNAQIHIKVWLWCKTSQCVHFEGLFGVVWRAHCILQAIRCTFFLWKILYEILLHLTIWGCLLQSSAACGPRSTMIIFQIDRHEMYHFNSCCAQLCHTKFLFF